MLDHWFESSIVHYLFKAKKGHLLYIDTWVVYFEIKEEKSILEFKATSTKYCFLFSLFVLWVLVVLIKFGR